MELHEKLQELRRQRGLTQEELAAQLYVSRTAVSKWESGRGYPSIDSLREIARFFSVTVDELLSSEELMTAAEEARRRTASGFRELGFGFLELAMACLLFLPLLATRVDGEIRATPLLALSGVEGYLRLSYFVCVIGAVLLGILTLALQGCMPSVWVRRREVLSLCLGAVTALLFVVSSQPYAAVFSLALLAMKTAMLLKRT